MNREDRTRRHYMNRYFKQKDDTLLSEIKRNDLNAFDELFRRYYAGLCAFAMQYVSKEDAEEVVQDTMVWLWENREYVIVDVSLKGYLFRTIRNKCLSHIARDKMKEKVHTEVLERSHAQDEEDVCITKEMGKNIEEEMAKLPDSYRVALEMNRFEGKTYKEIAGELNVSPKTIDYRIQQALKALRKGLKEYFTR